MLMDVVPVFFIWPWIEFVHKAGKILKVFLTQKIA